MYGKTDIKILNSTQETLYIEIEIDAITAADLYPKSIFVGLPNRILPETEIIYKEESPIPFKSEQSNSSIFSDSHSKCLADRLPKVPLSKTL